MAYRQWRFTIWSSHNESGDLIVGTHGRSLYKANIKLLRGAAQESGAMAISAPATARYSSRYGTRNFDLEISKPELAMAVYNPGASAGAELRIKMSDGTTIYQRDLELIPGVNQFTYDQTYDGRFAEMIGHRLTQDRDDDARPPIVVKAADDGQFYLRPGEYTISVAAGNNTVESKLEVK